MILFLKLGLVISSILYNELASAQQSPTAWTASPFSPFGLPLAVRSPYLNTWLAQGNNPPRTGKSWATYWNSEITGWFVAIMVDDEAYELAGGDAIGFRPLNGSVTQKSVSFSPTNTSFSMQTGPMDVTLTFLSPAEPYDLLRQSLPFSYMYITAESNDGGDHNVRMYSDITGEFLRVAPGANVSWLSNDDGTNIILSEQLIRPVPFGEMDNHALDAVEYYCYKRINGTTTSWQISSSIVTRDAATNMSTSLNNTADSGQRLLSDQWPVLGIQTDWGWIKSTPEPAVFTLGIIRDPVIQYMLPNGTIQMRSPYYKSSFKSDIDALKFFMSDFERAKQAAEVFDSELLQDGSMISSEYADLLSLTTRQVLSSIDITLAKGDDGNWNFTDTLVFMKNIGAAGSDTPTSDSSVEQSVNTVDTLFAAFPAFLYLNPELAGYLLTPLLKYQDSTAYNQEYAARNIGSKYPNATADSTNIPHPFGVEETSNMLIMILAYSQLSENYTLINNHYGLLQKWGQYLNENAMAPSNQLWADYLLMQNDLPANNQSNLALKGIIAIAAMSKIATIVRRSEDAYQFNEMASSFIQAWEQNALSQSQINYFYGDANRNGLIYNLYADVLLGLDFVSASVYATLTTYYDGLSSENGGFGIPLMNEIPGLTSVSAMMLSAATVTNDTTRNAMISQVHNYASSNFNNTPFGGLYDPIWGFITNENIPPDGHGINSPTVGGIFSLLVGKNMTKKTGDAPGSSSDSRSAQSKSEISAIVGSAVGTAFILALVFLRRRHRKRQAGNVSTPAKKRRGLTMFGLGLQRDVAIEPNPHLGAGDLNNDPHPWGRDAFHSQQSKNRIPMDSRDNRHGPVLVADNLAASFHAEDENWGSVASLLARSGSNNSRIGHQQSSGSGSSLPCWRRCSFETVY